MRETIQLNPRFLTRYAKHLQVPLKASGGGWEVHGKKTVFVVDREAYRKVMASTPPPKRKAKPVLPLSEWPRWARFLARLKADQDKGVGDTVQHYAAKLGGERFKKIMTRIGAPCRCTDRQAAWNARFPYEKATSAVKLQ